MRRLPFDLRCCTALLLGGLALWVWIDRDDPAPLLPASPGATPTPAPAVAIPEPAPAPDRSTPPAQTDRSIAAPTADRSRLEVVLEEGGEPLIDIEVRLSGGDLLREGRTDPVGRFVALVPPGEYRLEVPGRNVSTTVRAAPRASSSARISVPGPRTLSGQILDAVDLSPLESVWIEVFPREADPLDPAYTRLAWTQSDRLGRFSIAGLPDRPLRVRLHRRGHADLDQIATPTPDREFRLNPLGALRVQVVGAGGVPAALQPAEIEIHGPAHPGERHEVFLDQEGRLFVTDLPSGLYRLRVRVDGHWSRSDTAFATPQETLPLVLTIDEEIAPHDNIPIPAGPDDLQEPDDPRHPDDPPHHHAGEWPEHD